MDSHSSRSRTWVALMFVDCDGFKDINDTLGHEQGDALELEIRAFLSSIREGRPAVVSGEDGLRALETAIRITELVQASEGVR